MRSFQRFLSLFRALPSRSLRRRHRGGQSLLLWILLTSWLWGPLPSFAAQASFADSTFIQLVEENAHWSQEQWESLFQEMQGMGIREVVVQWTRYGNQEFIPQVEKVLNYAARFHMRVWVGLYSPEDWWTQINKPAQLLEVYVWQVLYSQLELARRVVELFGSSPAFVGLYLPIEIDDGTWHSAENTRVLLDCLSTFARRAESQVPGRTWAISGFSNGIVPPSHLADFWKEVMRAGNLQRLYFQDGVGAHKLTSPEAASYVRALARTLIPQGRQVVTVVEAFTQVDGAPINDKPFAAKPTSLQSLQQQVTLAREAGATAASFFAVPNYMSSLGGAEAAALGRRWRAVQR